MYGHSLIRATALVLLFSGASYLHAQDDSSGTPQAGKDPGATLLRADPGMRAVLEKLQDLGAKPIAELTPEQARKNPTPAQAAQAVLDEQGGAPEQSKLTVKDARYEGPAGEQRIRIYRPMQNEDTALLPVIVYFHGGGWVLASIETYEASAKALARKSGAIVMSAEYRHAPEHKFPAAHMDAFSAYQWALANAKRYGGDPLRIAVAGESAGGNLAANVALMARERNVQPPVHMLLVYPVASTDMNTASYQENASAKPLSKPAMEWFFRHALEPDDRDSPMINLVDANLRGLPPATVITAAIDPLMSEGRLLAQRLRDAGVPTRYENFDGVTHEFFGMAGVVADADRAQALAAARLRAAFEANGATAEHDSDRTQQ